MAVGEINFAAFHFLRPVWLWALIPLSLVAILWARQRLSRGSWVSVCDGRLLPYILEDSNGRDARWPLWAFFFSGILCVVALAGPTWKQRPSPVFRNESAVVIVLDLSRSMDATDIKPSRLRRANYKISDILKLRKDGQTALVVYAADAFTVTPLTDDTETIQNQLSALTTRMMPAQGSRADIALRRAEDLLKQAGMTDGSILLVTDGVDISARQVAKQLNAEGYKISVLGVGTPDGAPIPEPNGGFVKDASGNIVVVKLLDVELARLANDGGGIFRSLSTDNQDVKALISEFDVNPNRQQKQAGDLHIDQWEEAGPWLLLVVLPLASLAFRRGYLLLFIWLFFPFPGQVYALEWADLWQTRDQQAYAAYQNGNTSKAAELFQNSEWKAAAEYANQKYENALQSLANKDDAISHYNRGNALSRLGRFPEALDAYEKALDKDSSDEDARYNKEIIKKYLQQQKKPGQSQSKHGADENNDMNKTGNQNANNQPGDDRSDANPSDQQQSEQEAQPSPDNTESGQEQKSLSQQSQEGDGGDESDANRAVPQESSEQGDENVQQAAVGESDSEKEMQQANEQWLRRIPDDPGGLLRRKFKYQYKQRGARPPSGTDPW